LTVAAGKPGGSPEFLVLAEGQAQNEVEVKEIDEKGGTVKVMNHKEEQILDFIHDGAKPMNAPPGSLPYPMQFAPTAIEPVH